MEWVLRGLLRACHVTLRDLVPHLIDHMELEKQVGGERGLEGRPEGGLGLRDLWMGARGASRCMWLAPDPPWTIGLPFRR